MYGQSAKKSGGHYRQVGAINGAKPTLIQAYIVKNKIKTEHSSHAVFCLVFFCSNFAPISRRTNLQISYVPFSFSFILSFISFLL